MWFKQNEDGIPCRKYNMIGTISFFYNKWEDINWFVIKDCWSRHIVYTLYLWYSSHATSPVAPCAFPISLRRKNLNYVIFLTNITISHIHKSNKLMLLLNPSSSGFWYKNSMFFELWAPWFLHFILFPMPTVRALQ
jgi:hypothetical protein